MADEKSRSSDRILNRPTLCGPVMGMMMELMPFLREYEGDWKTASSRWDRETGDLIVRIRSPRLRYARNTYMSLLEVLFCVTDMAIPLFWLEQDRGRLDSAVPTRDRTDHARYEIENYAMRFQLLWDRTLILTSVGLELDLSRNEVRWETINCARGVRETRLLMDLQRLHAKMRPIRKVRNFVVHRASLDSKPWRDADLPRLMRELGEPVVLSHEEEVRELDSVLDATLQEIELHETEVAVALTAVFRTLADMIIARLKALQHVSAE